MKTVKYLNTFAIGLPFAILITYPIFKESSLLYSLSATMATGFVQVVLGLWMRNKFPNETKLQIYIASVIAFFALWLINAQLGYLEILGYILFIIPPILAIYLSITIYKSPN